MIHQKNQNVDCWRTDFIYPLIELKPMKYFAANFSTGQTTVEYYLLRDVRLNIHEMVEYTVEYLEPDYNVMELIE